MAEPTPKPTPVLKAELADTLEVQSTSVLTPEQEIRLRCIEAAALAWSGNRYGSPMSHVVLGLAEDMIQKVLNG